MNRVGIFAVPSSFFFVKIFIRKRLFQIFGSLEIKDDGNILIFIVYFDSSVESIDLLVLLSDGCLDCLKI